ncbi:DUF123 domain-containing protein [Metallosphaera tengchongensis]|uniref:DUF123 domain-containing protein n=1 Tax=Metallosphaera tengchongensis TaxID=1532350 RepID=A0A6N0NTW1_9CREN|nr:DUF123 domain-containing protein [Metallosphaera tengchongensis]QKR00314.1 DUF123 domain-containing protein [Metallosphaera tengchongensis]
MKGYVVFFKCHNGVVETGGRKSFKIEEGLYAYVGSCGISCGKRVSRHLDPDKEKLHWHVDYLSRMCEPLGALVLNVEERTLASYLSKFPSVRGFGSTDDRENESHLFKGEVEDILRVLLSER